MYTVIIIDDKLNINPTFISSIDWKRCGFELVGYSDIGEEGIKLIQNLNPDILIVEAKIKHGQIDVATAAREINPNLEIIFFTQSREFDDAKKAASLNALEYILKPISSDDFENILIKIKATLDLKKQNEKNIDFNDVKDYFLASILLQKHTEEEINRKINNFSLELAGEEFFIINVGFKSNQNNKPALSFFNTVKNIFKKYLKGECLVLNDLITIIIADCEVDVKNHLNLMLVDIIQSLGDFPDIKSTIGVSNKITSLLFAPIAYLQAKNALLYSFREKNEIVLFQEIKKKELEPSFFEDIRSNLAKKIRFEDNVSVKEYINLVFNEIRINKISLSNFYMCLFEMISVCNNIEVEEFNQNLKFSFLESIINNQSIDLIQQKITEKSCELCRKIIDQRQNGVEKIVEQAIVIINENYKNSDFSLKILSQNLHVSSNYLCAIIKKIKGDSFINIITQVRMNKAKELLQCSNSRVQEIAYEVGYTDQHYFSFCFKKHFGITPKEMRGRENRNLTGLSE